MSRAYLIFGAYGGIGSSLARTLAEQGDRVVLSGRDPDELQDLATELDAPAIPADATDLEEVQEAVSGALDELQGLDGVASCVGSLLLKPAHLTRPQEWMDTVHTNLTSAFAVVRASAKPLMDRGGGSVVLVSTAAAKIGLPNHDAIAAAKGGVDALVRSAAATYGSSGLRINAVAPGLVETPLTKRITENEKARSASEAMHALGRLGTPAEVTEVMAWLLSERASWITGQVLGVDGGLSRVRSA
ncbi:MAG: SDR family oxidoreductase [Longimicrobiales bacterium]|nr:SDR family oxidoreductase [Longimicrobiales bacterium]